MDNPLQVKALSVTIHGKPIVRDVTWHAQRGKVSAILGPNGAGKSTFLKAIAGLLPHTGSAALEGKPIDQHARAERARRMAWVPQESNLHLPLRVRELVAQGRFAHLGPLGRLVEEDHAIVAQALEDVACTHLATRSWNTLSGGERRRVMIARGLCTGANVLLLDEPTASLDIEHALRVMLLMRSLADRGYTVVPVLHDLDLAARYADHVMIMNQGRAAFQGAPAEVLTAENLRAVYHVTMAPQGAMAFQLPSEP